MIKEFKNLATPKTPLTLALVMSAPDSMAGAKPLAKVLKYMFLERLNEINNSRFQ